MTGLLSIDVEEGSPPVLLVHGELDLSTAEQLGAALEDGLSADPTLVVDMADVTFVGVAGLRVILRAAESLSGAGPLTLVNASLVARLLELVELREIPSLDLRDN